MQHSVSNIIYYFMNMSKCPRNTPQDQVIILFEIIKKAGNWK